MAAEYSIRHFTSSDGEHKIAMYTWAPSSEKSKGVVQILHGMREHMGRYGDFASFCVSQGFIVCGHDHLGHGKTAGKQEDFGYFGKDRGCGYLLADARRVARLAAKEYPDIPFFLLGHSMGSFLGRVYILRPPVGLAGFVCMGTGGEIKGAPLARALAEIAVKAGGDRRTSRLLNRLVISPSLIGRPGSPEDLTWLSRDSAAVDAYGADGMTRPLFTNRAICDLITLQMASTSGEWAGRVDKDLPILLLSGDRDVVGHNGRGVVETYERLQAAGCRDVECKLYEGARHELLNELNKEEVYYDIYRWITKRLPR